MVKDSVKKTLHYLDGSLFRKSIIASTRHVNAIQDHLNEINVFPVADGDTGTNMAMTMDSIAEGAERCKKSTFESISNAIADSALHGARGNSGVILAQFFHGLAEATKGKEYLNTESFARAAAKAAERARNAISNPREGTIITVMKDWAAYLSESAARTHDFKELLQDALSKAKDSLADTPNKLKMLKDAGVVDAGAQGFVCMLEGMYAFIESGKTAAQKLKTQVAGRIKRFQAGTVFGAMDYTFCTECLVTGVDIDAEALRSRIAHLGDSLIVIGSPQTVRIHIHTNEPDTVFAEASAFGTVSQRKVDDMETQTRDVAAGKGRSKIALITDSTCDLPPEMLERYNVHLVPVLIQVGKRSYLDRLEIQPADFYTLLRDAKERLSTSQPPPAYFKEVYDRVVSHYDAVLSVHISEKLSGTIQGALTGSREGSYRDKVHVIDSKTSSAALGLLVAEAGRLIEKGVDLNELSRRMKSAIDHVKIFIAVPTLKYVMRSGRLSRTKGILGTILNLKPVLSVSPEGTICEAAKVIGQKRVFAKTLSMAMHYAESVKNPRFSVVHALAPRVAHRYRKEIRSRFDVDNVMTVEASPALAVHIGIGGIAVAVLGDYQE